MNEVIAAWSGVLAAILLALNIDISKYSYLLFLLSSMLWTEYGIRIKHVELAIMNAVFSFINIIGIFRWIL